MPPNITRSCVLDKQIEDFEGNSMDMYNKTDAGKSPDDVLYFQETIIQSESLSEHKSYIEKHIHIIKLNALKKICDRAVGKKFQNDKEVNRVIYECDKQRKLGFRAKIRNGIASSQNECKSYIHVVKNTLIAPKKRCDRAVGKKGKNDKEVNHVIHECDKQWKLYFWANTILEIASSQNRMTFGPFNIRSKRETYPEEDVSNVNKGERLHLHVFPSITLGKLARALEQTNSGLNSLEHNALSSSLVLKKDHKPYERTSQDSFSSSLDHSNVEGYVLKPCSVAVYMIDSYSQPRHNSIPTPHPNACGAIPWTWLREEKWRLHTYANYPTNTVKSAILLAEDGFAYVGSGRGSDDSVICFFCCVIKSDWQVEDDIHTVHQAMSPACSMVTKINCDNIPLIPASNVSFATGRLPHQKHRNSDRSATNHSIETDPTMGEASGHSSHHRNTPAQASATASSHPHAQQQPFADNASSATVTSSDATSFFSKDARCQHTEQENPPVNASSVGGGQQDTCGQNNRSVPQSSTTSASSNAASNKNAPTVSSNSNSSTNHSGSSGTSSNSNTTTSGQNQANMTTESTPAGSNSQGNDSGNSSQQQTPAPSVSERNPTYQDLGIITDRPKRFEYAVKVKRLDTFANWPVGHHLTKEVLADAGFYYAGYGDCARCFYCGGGLRNWEKDDDVWVEHARWFPKCAFIRQQLGPIFVATVQRLAAEQEEISFKEVTDKMNVSESAFQISSKATPLKNDPAVLILKELGYNEEDTLKAAIELKESGSTLSSDALFEKLQSNRAARSPVPLDIDESNSVTSDSSKDLETITELKEQNNQLRTQTQCKICMDKEVAVVFLPCGHFISCTECAAAMKDCPVCRKPVKGIVRAFIG